MSSALVSAPNKSAAVRDQAFSQAIETAQAEIAEGVEKGGLRNDVYRFPLAALSTVIGVFPEFLSQVRQAAHETRMPLDPAFLTRLEQAATEGAYRSSAALVRAHNRRSVVIGSVAVAVLVVGSLVGGYWWGRSDAIGRFRLAEAGFAAAMHNSPAAATGWLSLARMNDYDTMMNACRGAGGFRTAEGRHACNAPIWLDEDTATAAPEKAAKP